MALEAVLGYFCKHKTRWNIIIIIIIIIIITDLILILFLPVVLTLSSLQFKIPFALVHRSPSVDASSHIHYVLQEGQSVDHEPFQRLCVILKVTVACSSEITFIIGTDF